MAGLRDDPMVETRAGVPCNEPLFAVALLADQGDAEGYWSTAMREAAEQLEGAPGLADEEADAETELDRIMASWEG